MKTALIYIRQSRHKDYERTVSPEAQEKACRALPAVMACDAVTVYPDLDVSGGSFDGRPGLAAMLDRIKSTDTRREPLVVATYDQSRFSRSNIDSARIYAIFEKRPWVEVAFVDGRFDRSPSGELSWTVLAAAGAHLRKTTGQKIKEAKRFAASRGEMVGAVPAGYQWDGTGRDRKLVIDEPVAAIVRRVFSDYATGLLSTHAIAYRLNIEGIRLPKFKGGWRADTVAQLLGNPAYIAQTYINRRHREGEPIPAKWPAIIEQGQWDQVQRLLSRFHRKGGRRNQATGLERFYVFQGLLRCAKCGRRLHCHAMRHHIYYDCRAKEAADPCPNMVREDALLPWAEGLMRVLDEYRDRDLGSAVASGLAEPPARSAAAQIESIDSSLDRLGKRFEWGHVAEADYRAEWERLTARKAELIAVQGAAVNSAAILPLGSLMEGWNTGNPRTRRDLLAVFFDELTVKDGTIFEVVPRKDREALVVELLRRAYAYRDGSPGGIRTRDLSLERAAS